MSQNTHRCYVLIIVIIFVFVIRAKCESNIQVFERCPGNSKLQVLKPLTTLTGKANVIRCADECTKTQNCLAANFCTEGGATACELLQETVDMTTCDDLLEEESCTFVQMVNRHSKDLEVHSSVVTAIEETTTAQSATDQSSIAQSTTDPSTTDQSATDQSSIAQSTTDPSTTVQSATAQSKSDQSTTAQSTTGLSSLVIGEIYTENELVGSYPNCSATGSVGSGCFDYPRDCTEIYNHGYRADVKLHVYIPYNYFFVQCNMQDTKRGVTKLFVHGEPCGVEDYFYRIYTTYEYNFGVYGCDHWLGLHYMYKITSLGDYTLRIDIRYEDNSGNINTDTVYYDKFYITDKSDGYKFYYRSFLGSTHGMLGDGFGDWINGTEFKASMDGTCPDDKSGWWFDPYCNNTNLMVPMGTAEESFQPGVRKPYWPDASGQLLLVKAITMGVYNEKYT